LQFSLNWNAWIHSRHYPCIFPCLAILNEVECIGTFQALSMHFPCITISRHYPCVFFNAWIFARHYPCVFHALQFLVNWNAWINSRHYPCIFLALHITCIIHAFLYVYCFSCRNN
jgi:hypothetical protein